VDTSKGSERDFCAAYLDRIGHQLDFKERASAGLLPEYLATAEITELATLNVRGGERAWMQMMDSLDDACRRGEIAGARHLQDRKDRLRWYIHRDEARRYFQALDVMPAEGSPLWCWLRGKPAAEAQTLRPEQQDKADFQQFCIERWRLSPTVPITGEAGIVMQVARSYLRKYARRTLEGWAREVAPEGVKGRRGRPKKIDGQDEIKPADDKR